MSVLDIFAGDAFKLVSLTTALNRMPYKPGRIGELGIFEDQGVATLTIMVEEQSGVLSLIPSKPRGSTQQAAPPKKKKARSFIVPHLPLDTTILAEDLQGRRAFGSDSEAETVATVVNDRMEQLRQNHEVTLEWLRCGALQGAIVDGDGSTSLYNLFTEFGLAESSVDFVFTDANDNIRQRCLNVLDSVEAALGSETYQHVHCLAGKTWFRTFVEHPQVKYAYQYYQENQMLRNDPRKGFEFCGIIFEEYRGNIGNNPFIPVNVARFFPVGTPGLFKTHYAPADFVETVNTIGVPFYAKQERIPFDKGVMLHTQSNPLPLCHRPATLVKGTMS